MDSYTDLKNNTHISTHEPRANSDSEKHILLIELYNVFNRNKHNFEKRSEKTATALYARKLIERENSISCKP